MLIKNMKKMKIISGATVIILGVLFTTVQIAQAEEALSQNSFISSSLTENAEATPTPNPSATPAPTTTNPLGEYNKEIKKITEIFSAKVDNFKQNSAYVCDAINHITHNDLTDLRNVSDICGQLLEVLEYQKILSTEIMYIVDHPTTDPETVNELIGLHEGYSLAFGNLSEVVQKLLDNSPDSQALIENLISSEYLNILLSSLDETKEIKENIQDQIELIQFDLDQELLLSIEDTVIQTQKFVLIGIILLVILAAMTMRIFARAGQMTSPLLNMINAVVALDGNQYRSDLLKNIVSQRNLLGRAAREFDRLAEEVITRENSINSEIEILEKQLYEAKRKKLTIYSDGDEIEN